MKIRSSIFSIIVFISLLFITAESSALMVGLTTEELTKNSGLVIQGVVEDKKSLWSRDGKTIITQVTVRYTNLIKGKAKSKKVVVEYDGGEMEDIMFKVSDTPEFTVGEEVILFLRNAKSKRDGDVFNAVGEAQGKYSIDEDGIARKRGFSFIPGTGFIDNHIPVEKLVEKIKKVKSQ